MTEQLPNLTAQTLIAPVAAGDTAINVSNPSVLPATGTYRFVIGTEILEATSGGSNPISVVRATEGTVAQAYAVGTTVTPALTHAALLQFMTDILTLNPALTSTYWATPTPTSAAVALNRMAAAVYALRGNSPIP